jgi:GDP-L-fucose synthase
MDNGKLRSLGWEPQISLKDGLANAYQWYVDNIDTARR